MSRVFKHLLSELPRLLKLSPSQREAKGSGRKLAGEKKEGKINFDASCRLFLSIRSIRDRESAKKKTNKTQKMFGT